MSSSRRGELNSRPLSYQESVLPLNYSGKINQMFSISPKTIWAEGEKLPEGIVPSTSLRFLSGQFGRPYLPPFKLNGF